MAYSLPPNHFLLLPRPGVSHLGTVPDTSTLAAHDFDVDVRTGFMPPQPPLARLPLQWEPWEQALESVLASRLKLGESKDLSEEDKLTSENWRQRLRQMPIIPTEELTTSEVMLRRAHHVLTFMLHIFIHSLPPDPSASEIHIPPSISVPLLQVSSHLVLTPVLTYSDNVLYNWDLTTPQSPHSTSINPAHLRSQTTFTGTRSEEHFYLTSARIEFAGVSALSLLRSTLDEAFVGDTLSLHRISHYLNRLAEIIDEMTSILDAVRDHCDPGVFYDEIRPWFRGQGSQRWVFDGVETQPTELSGPSAGQSSLIHALDIFLGIDQYAHAQDAEPPFLKRMQAYMPRHHRAFLNHLKATPRPVRQIAAESPEVREAYNASVCAVRRFRDAHIRVATLYIVSQGRRVTGERGTGGTDLVPFLKGIRDNTAAAVLEVSFIS